MATKHIVAMLKEEGGRFGYANCPYVLESNHPRFVEGSRFDYGFLQIALAEGYTILFVGNKVEESVMWKDGELVRERGPK